jgi:hypothetical protein
MGHDKKYLVHLFCRKTTIVEGVDDVFNANMEELRGNG